MPSPQTLPAEMRSRSPSENLAVGSLLLPQSQLWLWRSGFSQAAWGCEKGRAWNPSSLGSRFHPCHVPAVRPVCRCLLPFVTACCRHDLLLAVGLWPVLTSQVGVGRIEPWLEQCPPCHVPSPVLPVTSPDLCFSISPGPKCLSLPVILID